MGLKEKTVERAQKYILKGYLDKAIAEYQSALDLDPRDISIRLRLGDLFVKTSKNREAIAQYTEAAKANTQRGFYLKAIAVYKQVLKLDDTVLDVHNKLAELYIRQRLIADAISEYSYIVSVQERLGRTDDVLELLKKMIEIDPENIGVRLKLAELYMKRSFDKDGLAEYTLIYQKLVDQGKLDLAEKIFTGLYTTHPEDPRVLNPLTDLYKAKGQADEFARYARELAGVYASRGEVESARAVYSTILEVMPEDPEALGFMEQHVEEAVVEVGGEEGEGLSAARSEPVVPETVEVPEPLEDYAGSGNFTPEDGVEPFEDASAETSEVLSGGVKGAPAGELEEMQPEAAGGEDAAEDIFDEDIEISLEGFDDEEDDAGGGDDGAVLQADVAQDDTPAPNAQAWGGADGVDEDTLVEIDIDGEDGAVAAGSTLTEAGAEAEAFFRELAGAGDEQLADIEVAGEEGPADDESGLIEADEEAEAIFMELGKAGEEPLVDIEPGSEEQTSEEESTLTEAGAEAEAFFRELKAEAGITDDASPEDLELEAGHDEAEPEPRTGSGDDPAGELESLEPHIDEPASAGKGPVFEEQTGGLDLESDENVSAHEEHDGFGAQEAVSPESLQGSTVEDISEEAAGDIPEPVEGGLEARLSGDEPAQTGEPPEDMFVETSGEDDTADAAHEEELFFDDFMSESDTAAGPDAIAEGPDVDVTAGVSGETVFEDAERESGEDALLGESVTGEDFGPVVYSEETGEADGDGLEDTLIRSADSEAWPIDTPDEPFTAGYGAEDEPDETSSAGPEDDDLLDGTAAEEVPVEAGSVPGEIPTAVVPTADETISSQAEYAATGSEAGAETDELEPPEPEEVDDFVEHALDFSGPDAPAAVTEVPEQASGDVGGTLDEADSSFGVDRDSGYADSVGAGYRDDTGEETYEDEEPEIDVAEVARFIESLEEASDGADTGEDLSILDEDTLADDTGIDVAAGAEGRQDVADAFMDFIDDSVGRVRAGAEPPEGPSGGLSAEEDGAAAVNEEPFSDAGREAASASEGESTPIDEAFGTESEEDLSDAISELMDKIEPEEHLLDAGSGTVVSEESAGPENNEFVDLTAELGMEEALEGMAGSWDSEESADTFDEFKSGIGKQLSREDTETHYNLGIAYMEMELYTEASKEFKIALKDPRLEFDCYTRLGLCAMEDANPHEAVVYYLKGLKLSGITDDERKGIIYELALAYEAAGEAEEAAELFASIYESDPGYREVAAKVTRSHVSDNDELPHIPLDDGLIEVELL